MQAASAADTQRATAGHRGQHAAAALVHGDACIDVERPRRFQLQVLHAGRSANDRQIDRLRRGQARAIAAAADMQGSAGDRVQVFVRQAQGGAGLGPQRDGARIGRGAQRHLGRSRHAAGINAAAQVHIVGLQLELLSGHAAARQLPACAIERNAAANRVRQQADIGAAHIGLAGHAKGNLWRRQRQVAVTCLDQGVDADTVARLYRESHAGIEIVDIAHECHVIACLQAHIAGGTRDQAGIEVVRRIGKHIAEILGILQAIAAAASDHVDVARIEQPVTRLAAARAGARIDADAVDGQGARARGFDQAAVTGGGPAARGNAAVHLCGIIAPYDDLAAVATVDGIGRDADILADEHLPRILHVRVLALVVAAQQDRAAARGAAGVDSCIAEQAHLVAQHGDFAALAGRPRGAGDAARFKHGLAAGLEHDPAILADDGAVGIEHAALADQRAGHADAAALGDDLAQVQRLVVRCRDQHAQLRIAGVRQLHAAPGRQDHFAIRRRDDARVFHVRRDQQHLPALARIDHTSIADAAGYAAGRELVLAGQEVLIRHAQAGRHQTVHVHLRAVAEDDAVRVDQENLAIRFQAAQDLAGVLSRDAVEHGATAVLLDEARDLARMDGKALPVDDGVGRVRDREDVALLVERRLSVDHLRQGGVGLRGAETAGQQQCQRRAAQGRRKR